MVKRPVRDVETERLAREALELHFALQSPITADAVDTAMGLYAKAFGYGASLAFVNRVNRELSEKAWLASTATS